MKGRIRRSVTVIGAVTLAALLAVPGAALAKGGPPAGAGAGKGGGGGGGAPPVTEIGNNLSVPAIFVGGNPFSLVCDGPLIVPTGDPTTGYPDDPALYYYVQGVNKWQAQCLSASAAIAAAEWGDNLTGDAKLSVGSPIRVEVGLNAGAQGLTGYFVEKLDEVALDREAPYGTLATAVEGGFVANPVTVFPVNPETRVWAYGATMTVVGPGANISQAATAEINATGRVVYGYNLRVTAAGVYTITFTFPNVTISEADAGTVSGSSVSLDITVAGGGGGGGGGGRR